MNKGIIALAIVIVLGGGAYWFMNQSKSSTESAVNTDTSSAMRVENNSVIATDQPSGNTVTVSQVHLAAPGFVVIHDDNNGAPGAIIGFSGLLQAGDSNQVLVKLSKAVLDGTKLYAMLHNDTDGNGKFDAAVDMPVQSVQGGPIEGWFNISADASANPAVSI